MYKCVLFDMDGTLVNSYEGIAAAYRWTFAQMGKPFPGGDFVQKAIGAPLHAVFAQLCGWKEEEAGRAVCCYRDYYEREGKKCFTVYDGMEETLRGLRAQGCFLGIATLKKESFARDILKQANLLPWFHAVCGTDRQDRFTKADLIERGRWAAGVSREETVLVGDSIFDLEGAEEAGVAFLAVTYGFGFRTPQSRRALSPRWTAHTPGEILKRLAGEGLR